MDENEPQKTRSSLQKIEKIFDRPWRFHGLLIMKVDSSGYLGSGALIGDRYVLTAAHNYMNPKLGRTPEKITFYAGYNNKQYIGEAEAKCIAVHRSWIETYKTPSPDYSSDIAVITLKTPINLNGESLAGQALGHFGVISPSGISDILNLTGYPQLQGDPSMYNVELSNIQIKEGKLSYNTSTFSGQSGGNIWGDNHQNEFHCLAVHSHSDSELNSRGFGASLDVEKIKWIKGKMRPQDGMCNYGEHFSN
ncbi:MAG: hypothetical protein BGO67_04055 [Alphaproteobacteria bacterium 41-28]|nr:MAG: hypothetical protein BGO67_04055 [Alphaproteobacteria bacterium 41-28]